MRVVALSAFGGPDNFVDADHPEPMLSAGSVRVAVRAASFNPVDCQIRRGLSESARLRSMILGRDFSGVVEAVHADVVDIHVGDEVFGYVCDLTTNGTYAEYVCVPAELTAPKPGSLTHEQAAAVPVAGVTALLALERARVDRNKSVFIAGGAGGVGSFAIALAVQQGVRNLVTTAGRRSSRAYLIEACGLNDAQIVDYQAEDFAAQAIERNGGSFDVVLDLVGGRMLSACCALLAVDGHLASVVDAPSRDDFEVLFQRNATFHSVGANAYSLVPQRAGWRTYRALLGRLAQHFDRGALAPPTVRVLGHLSSDIVRNAHELLETGGVQGKLVMTC